MRVGAETWCALFGGLLVACGGAGKQETRASKAVLTGENRESSAKRADETGAAETDKARASDNEIAPAQSPVSPVSSSGRGSGIYPNPAGTSGPRARARAMKAAQKAGVIGVLTKREDQNGPFATLMDRPVGRLELRVDAARGGFGKKLAASLLRGAEERFQECAKSFVLGAERNIDFVLEVKQGAAIGFDAQGAKPEAQECLAQVLGKVPFPTGKEATRIEGTLIFPRGGFAAAGSGLGIGTGLGARGSRPRIGGVSAGPGRTLPKGAQTSSASLSKPVIQRVIRSDLPRIRHCYEKQLRNHPKLAGRVDVRLEIGPSGRVTRARARGLGKGVSPCVERAIRQLRFPRPKGGGIVKVNYPFRFVQPSGGES